MAVRKIPLKEHQPLDKPKPARFTGPEFEADDTVRALSDIRAKIRTDRALHDLVSIVPIFPFADILTCSSNVGYESIRLIRARLLETRGLVYIPYQGP